MRNLNNLDMIKQLDPVNVFGSSGMLKDQCTQVWQDVKNLNVSFPNVKNIIICGMGGSSYGGHVIKSLFFDGLTIPLIIVNDYHLPSFADSSTFVLLTSYSGTTEETLSCAKEAKEKKCRIAVLTSGGDLGKLAKEENYPGLVFEPKYNPSAQPRLGTGYIVLGSIALLNKTGIISIENDIVYQAIEELKHNEKHIMENARNLAEKIESNIPLIIAAEFLEGNAHIARNQINETAKSFSEFAVLPELNHHLMEGLKNPKGRKLIALFINSDFYSGNVKKRFTLTKEVVGKNNTEIIEYNAFGQSKISQVLNVLSFGAFLSFYLAILYDQNPSLIPWVDYFKNRLKK